MYVLKSTQKTDMQQNNAENPNSRKTLCKKTLMWTVRIYVMGKGKLGILQNASYCLTTAISYYLVLYLDLLASCLIIHILRRFSEFWLVT